MSADAGRHPLLTELRSGETVSMMGLRAARTTDIVRIAATTGHRAVMVDLEHSTMSLDVAGQLCATAVDLGLTPFVRTPEREYGAIGRLLDAGAQGIVAPRIESADGAATVAGACRFPPRGQRSQLSMVPQLGMRPTPATQLNPALDASTIVQVLVETPAGVAAADEIAAVEGIDMIGIGANDLTAELGIPGHPEHPAFRDAVRTVAVACRRHDVLLMIGGVGNLAALADLLALGACPLVMTGTDHDLLHTAARARVRDVDARIGRDQPAPDPTRI